MFINFFILFLSANCSIDLIGVFESWGLDGREIYSKTLGLTSQNITYVLAIEGTTGVRIAIGDEEAQRILERVDAKFFVPIPNLKVLSNHTPLAKYVFWGFYSPIPKHVYNLLKMSPDEEFIVNSVCTVGHSFIALKHGLMACWGDNTLCRDINEFTAKPNKPYVNFVYCPRFGSAVLTNVTIDKTFQLIPIGDATKGGFVQSKETRMRLAKADSVHFFAGNPHALAIVTKSGSVIAWGDPAKGGKYLLNASIKAKSIHSTNTSFTIVTKESRVYSWGTITEEDIPFRIRITGFQPIKKIYAGRDCYVALLQDLTIAVWGGKSAPYCKEDAENTEFIPYSAVKRDLKNVVHIVINDGAIAATTKHRSVIAWGKESHGGLPLNTKDFNLAFTGSLVGTCCAFAFIKKGLKIVAWGDPDYGGSPQSEISSISTSLKLSANEYFMATMMSRKTIILWGGPYKNKIAVISEKTSPYYNDYNYAHFFVTRKSIIAIRSRSCKTVETTVNFDCSRPCGGGVREQTYKVIQQNVNRNCSNLLKSVYTSCNTHPCIEKTKTTLADFTLSEYVVGAGCTGFLIVFLIWAVMNCINSQRPNTTEFKFSS